MRFLYHFIYTLIWSCLGLKHVLVQLGLILWHEAIALFGRAPSAQEINQTTKKLKPWKHLGIVLDHTHFNGHGMLSGKIAAQLSALAIVADSSHTSIFFPRQLTDSEQASLRTLISESIETLVNQSSKVTPQVTFYKSIYETLSDTSNEGQILSRIAQMVRWRSANPDLFKTSVKDTSWGVSGAKLSNLTDFEKTFANFALKSTEEEDSRLKHSNKSRTSIVTHRITFISPQDGKAAMVRMTQLLSKAAKMSLIREEDVDQALIHALLCSPEGELWPSTDFIINFKDTPTISGYPGWHLRYAEIVNAGQLGSGFPLVWHQFHKALCTYSKTVQRFGK